jgi:hypothetical protein
MIFMAYFIVGFGVILTMKARELTITEGWHFKLNKIMGKSHPNIYELLTVFQDVQNDNEIELRLLLLGNNAKKPKKKYRDIHQKIMKLRERLEKNDIDIIGFTDACSYQIRLR